MIDSTIVRAHQHSSGAAKKRCPQSLGRSVGGLSTKVHAKVDSFGYLLKVEISEGQVHESNYAQGLIDEKCDFLIADKAYDSTAFRDHLHSLEIEAVIPGKANRKVKIEYDREIYKERNIVERFFCKMKNFRRVATRFDKLDFMFRGTLMLVAVLIYLKI